ncbi:MAG: hypothetical protein A4E23_00011 [Methanomethylovorans sp. PtaU1.Bin073]|nr:MAG: hypothetical protein A4E23_00011 [Methanomethylovorans sp. PtaU1.Bin073]
MRPNARESQILKVESMHADVAQAGSRLKDPAGINISLLFAIGCREADLNNAFTWGIGRSLTTQTREDEGKDRPKVTGVAIAGESCSKPSIVFQKSWPETLISSVLCKNYLYSKPQKVPYISDINGTFQTNEYKINSRCSLVDRLFSDQKVIALLKNEQIILTSDLIAKHCARKIKLDFYTLHPDNTINFVMFESKNEYAISRLKLFLDNLGIPYVIERIVPIVRIKQNPDQFHVWILLSNTPADKARAFAESILKTAGFKVKGDKEIEYYPRQTKRNTHDIGERIPMPFGANSQVLVDCKFVKDFDEMTIGCVDLSSQPSDLEPNKWISGEGDDSSVAFEV